MHIFRSAHYEHDARVARARTEDGETEITQRSKQRREGMDEDSLKRHLQADLNALMNTIRLDSAVSLEDAPHVMHSVLNYGFRDLSDVTAQDLNSSSVVKSIRESLLDHEPRIIPESLDVKVSERAGGNRHRLSISVTAELMGDPVDVPIDFDAEVDLGAGKLHMSALRVQS
ncbi:type VI secretion system baseplate subunit TssE [Marivivens marinus]|uniref:type VI secretion system baseplate subunit TssE n=1 Tax=Marivivens marinus TaxID=3110173 RepID=UPI003B848D73